MSPEPTLVQAAHSGRGNADRLQALRKRAGFALLQLVACGSRKSAGTGRLSLSAGVTKAVWTAGVKGRHVTDQQARGLPLARLTDDDQPVSLRLRR